MTLLFFNILLITLICGRASLITTDEHLAGKDTMTKRKYLSENQEQIKRSSLSTNINQHKIYRLLNEADGLPNSLHTTETFIKIPQFEIKLALSEVVSNPALQMNTMQEDLQNVTVEHLSDFYKDYINENSNDETNRISSTFSRIFLIVSVVMEGDEGSHRKNNERNRNLHRTSMDIQTKSKEKQLRRTETASIAVSFVNAEIKGYAVYHGNATAYEKESVSRMATLAFMGKYHNLYIEKLQASNNKLLAATVQISTSVVSESPSKSKNRGTGDASMNRNEDYNGHHQNKNDEINKNTKEFAIRWRFILFFVLGCFTVGALVGTFVIYYVSRYIKSDDDNTEETSKDSLTGLSSRRNRNRSREYQYNSNLEHKRNTQSKPAESISVGVDDDGYDGGKEHENNYIGRSLLNQYQINKVRKKKKKRSPHKRRAEKKSAPEMNLTSIEEESDGDLYIDYVDDVVMGQMRKKGSLFPTLQDRLSNAKSKHLSRQTSYPKGYNDLYTPVRCTTLYETGDNGNDVLDYSNMVTSDILIPASYTNTIPDKNEEKESKKTLSPMTID